MPYRNSNQFESFARVYTTLADMRSDPDIAGASDGPETAILAGGAVAFDASPLLYVWNKDSAAADNGTTVIKPTNTVSTGRWVR